MILSNTRIVKCIRADCFSIDPLEHQDPGRSPYNTSAVDLHLGATISIPRSAPNEILDLRNPGIADFLSTHADEITLSADQPYVLRKGVFILGQTAEKVHFPIRTGQSYSARVEGKSSWARCGVLVHFTAPTIHAGWEGRITLELMNLGPYDFALFPGMAACQLIIEEVKGKPKKVDSQFHAQRTPAGKR
jgi:dCTP deaminase